MRLEGGWSRFNMRASRRGLVRAERGACKRGGRGWSRLNMRASRRGLMRAARGPSKRGWRGMK